ncbi:cytochrome c-type biogenesis protein [Aliidiomarina haloalkalitolerans]|uniref:Cytochrome c-type biogenesis protein n=1 Tax=Aliidiomarina haloalkalitolerans TaxID=859059 RepID=A0A432VPW8_9GAMM|nr:cytochrome c-type biogenesis protein [Aliidiomarina haloalkalitolerans]RUO18215.1 cystathionine gamma-synthase [Aliidiomarina haloalkalitolerans]
MMRLLFLLLTLTFTLGLGQSMASAEFYEFETAEQERRFNQLTGELRCPKCQNQTIADSDAPLSQDMRQRVYEMIMAGNTNAEIIDFMKVRYGDFVHYRPPVNRSTLILWFGPLLAFLIGIIVIVINVRMRRNDAEAELTAEEEARLRAVMAAGDSNESKKEEHTN